MRYIVFTWVIVLTFIIFDVVTGLLNAWYHGKLNSICLRHGLIHKFTELLTLFGCNLLEYAIDYLDYSIIPPLFKPFAIYICGMELLSIIENLSELNPDLNNFFKPYLEKLKDGDHEK